MVGRPGSGGAAVCFFTPLAIYEFGLNGTWLEVNGTRANRLGQFGDFVGGVLNPIFSFLAFCGLLYTVNLQRAELKEARNERLVSKILSDIDRTENSLDRRLSAVGPHGEWSALFDHFSPIKLLQMKTTELGMEWEEENKKYHISKHVLAMFHIALNILADKIKTYQHLS